ncbi:Photosystem II 5 kDa protein, chloroplastic-like protein [Drosera capensis]
MFQAGFSSSSEVLIHSNKPYKFQLLHADGVIIFMDVRLAANQTDRFREKQILEMASITMAASFLSGSVVTAHKPSSAAPCRGVVIAKAQRVAEASVEYNGKEQGSSNRRNLVFAAAAAVACTAAKIAMAEEEPKRGTPEAKKKYAPVCITMPTARICHK